MSALLEAYVDMLAETQIPNDYSLEVPDDTEKYSAIADCTQILGTYAINGANKAPDLSELPEDPQEALRVVRQWYQDTEPNMEIPPSGTYSALCGYLGRLSRTHPDLRKKLQGGLGDEQLITGLTHIFGAVFYDPKRQPTITEVQKKIRSFEYDAMATAFLQDALTIRNLGIDNPATKAAYAAPDFYMQKQGLAKPQPVEPELQPEQPPSAAQEVSQTTLPAVATPKATVVPRTTPQPHIRHSRNASNKNNVAEIITSAPEPDSINYFIKTSQYVTERIDRQQELELSRLIKAGKAAELLLAEGSYADDQKATLEEQVAAAKIAKNRLVESKLSQVVEVSRMYNHPSASIMDLVQDGVLGLMRAAEEFDPDKGVPFGSYAKFWIKKSITESIINTYPLVRIPDSHLRAAKKITQFAQGFYATNQRSPTSEEIMDGTGIKSEQFGATIDSSSFNSLLSLDARWAHTDGAGLTLSERTADNSGMAVEVEAVYSTDPIVGLARDVLAEANDSELGVILALRYGLNLGPDVLSDEFIARHNIKPGHSYSQEDIAPMLGMSRASVTRRHEKIISLLREKIKESPDLAQLFFNK